MIKKLQSSLMKIFTGIIKKNISRTKNIPL